VVEALNRRGVLGAIVENKRRELELRRAARGVGSLRSAALPSSRSLSRALAAPGARFLLECKKSSPSRGPIRPRCTTEEVVGAFAGLADALSVLTDGRYFGGSLQDLAVASRLSDVPVLQKDFVLDPYRVVGARVHGADAVLLLLSVLDDATARACMRTAAELSMECLVEVHDGLELERAVALGAPIIGVNNRDLVSLGTDLAVTERLSARVPADRLLVCESGISSRADVLRLAPRVDAFLVGSSLMSRTSIVRAARRLVFGRVKVCGLVRPEDAEAAAARGASFGGLVFAAGSPRAIGLAEAREVAERALARELPLVGVFVDEEPALVARTARELGLAAVQLYGNEDGDDVLRLRAALPEGVSVWKAVPVGGSGPVLEPGGVDRYLFDTAAAGRFGGTGRAFDWPLVEGMPELGRAILAGGLAPANAARAAGLGAWALDVGSGVEERPGVKSPELLARFFDALRPPSRGRTSLEGVAS
jgi:indole-3-glycerol phosphate synthase/phosphoribosylanthranilate isomerase